MELVLKFICLCVLVKNSTAVVNNSYVRLTRQITNDGCILPQHPYRGKWTIYQATSQLSPGQTVPPRTVLQVNCNENYKTDGDTFIFCVNGRWNSEIGKCLRTCSSRYSTPIMNVTCTYKGTELETCAEPIKGTRATFQCADFYEDLALEIHPVHVCRNGRWTHNLPECVPKCGQRSLKDPTLIVEGRDAPEGSFPWQVALYRKSNKELLCGGTLLNQKVVVTAAHCVANLQGEPFSKDLYMVAVGKYYRKYDHPNDTKYAQFSSIDEISVPRQYKGEIQRYFGDIAILITSKTFQLSIRTIPICVDWGLQHSEVLLNHTRETNTYVTGWGFTVTNKDPSDVLKELEVPLISEKECNKGLPQDYIELLTDDKFCAGFLDAGKSVCKGDSGGGLVTRFKGRYYFIGIVSVSARTSSTQINACDSNQYALYTRVDYYIEKFLLPKETSFRPGNENCDGDPTCETEVITTTTTTTSTEAPVTKIPRDSCILPQHPEFGNWNVAGSSHGTFSPGMSISTGTVLEIFCKKTYKIDGSNVVFCRDGKWSPEIPRCLKICPPRISSETMQVTCIYNMNKEKENCTDAVEGTLAKFQCAPFYEDVTLKRKPVHVCQNGEWDQPLPKCEPVCGQKTVDATTLIISGNNVTKGDYPWQVALYTAKDKLLICGGSLLSQRIILTAAHCVTDERGTIFPKENYIVSVGKYYRPFNDPRDKHEAQFSELQAMYIPVEYRATVQNYLGDIAILVTKESFILSRRVQPICLDSGLSFNLDKNEYGYIAGWGFTEESSRPSEVLKELKVALINTSQCWRDLPEDYSRYVTHDKFCAGYLNKGSSICKGDTGGGLVFKHEGRYYIAGIASLSPISPSELGGCDSQQYALYTKISNYITSFLLPHLSTHGTRVSTTTTTTTTEAPATSSSRDSCVLPQHPESGNWHVVGSAPDTFFPGMSVSTGNILEVFCKENYKIDGNNVLFCKDGKWAPEIGHCLKVCPPRVSSETLEVTCVYKNKEMKNCTGAVEGTLAKFKCAPFYEDLNLKKKPVHICQDGEWDQPNPICIPVCGQKSVDATTLIISGNNVSKGDYPWQVALYTVKENFLICGGSLVSQRIILTAAHCITDDKGTILPKENYIVAVGKYYRSFDDARDKHEAQFSELQAIYTPPQYRGFIQNYVGDIAILVTRKTFTLSRTVQPVCLDAGQSIFLTDKDYGYVTGWGFTMENSRPSEVLNELKVASINSSECHRNIPEDFEIYLTDDKLCAGYLDKGTSVCKGDGGGGLVFRREGRYYITGIVSVSPVSSTAVDGCDSHQYGFYTNVNKYFNFFILPKLSEFRT